jgi:hypothetical protein
LLWKRHPAAISLAKFLWARLSSRDIDCNRGWKAAPPIEKAYVRK